MWNTAENQIEIQLFFIRHGKTKANEEGRYLGNTDEALSEIGKRQMQELFLGPMDLIYSSPMKRCIQSAKILYPEQEIFLIENWKEMDFGLFEYKNYEELKDNSNYQAWIDSNGVLPFPEGESKENFELRCLRGLEEMMKNILSEAEVLKKKKINIFCSVHGGTVMSILSTFGKGQYFDYQVKNACGYRCKLFYQWGRKSKGLQVDAGLEAYKSYLKSHYRLEDIKEVANDASLS